MDKNYEYFRITQTFQDENNITYEQYHENEYQLFKDFTMGWYPLCSPYDF